MAQCSYKIELANDRCQGHARCVSLSPELFETDEDGNGRIRGDGSIPEELLGKAYLAQSNCPENAIQIVERQD